MAAQLSSNWKKLQAQIKAEPSKVKTATDKPAAGKLTAAANKTGTKSVTGKKRPRGAEEAAQKGKPQAKKPRPAGTTAGTKSTKLGPRPKPNGMGVAQSSRLSNEAAYDHNGKGQRLPKGVTPSLALWAEDHDISAEDMAQAYGLGGVATSTSTSTSGRVKVGAAAIGDTAAATSSAETDRENAGRTPNLAVGKYIALDCEMVGIGPDGREDALARVSVVDFFGRQVYDSFVKPQPGQRVTDWRTHVSGVSSRHLRLARPFDEVRTVVEDLLRGEDGEGKQETRILVGHDVRHDLQVLGLSHPPRLIRDTAKFSGFKQYGHGPKPALRVLAREILGIDIQQGAHSSVEDARVTMHLFRQHKPAFDVECANKFGPEPGAAGPSKGKSGGRKKKR
ncbi:3'-5' exonuclease [Sporothrix curviconia]|uniref:RNA exonuclease 4 n=1 Tax=Sporothrix curviconia TaxID=1260050 RepID=A0ABP0BFJ0_9PEZI